jgi:NAD(P)-dependent dehydrogenase (short-subunit alcohol dehydrogenase family)
MNFAGKVVLITGASSGIGRATAGRLKIIIQSNNNRTYKFFYNLSEHLSKLGASLALTGRKIDNLNEVATVCSKNGLEQPFVVAGDITNEQDNVNVMNETIKRFGKLDVLINNAGIIETGTIETTSLDQYDRVMNTNMRAIYHLTMLAVPHIIKTQGNIVNVSSVNGIRSFPGVLAYNLSKASVDQFTRCVALELAAKNVRCNSVNPGVTVTNLHKRGGMNDEAYEKFLEHSKTTHAMGRPGQASELAEAIVFLASEKASFITGVSLACDGGRHAMCPR